MGITREDSQQNKNGVEMVLDVKLGEGQAAIVTNKGTKRRHDKKEKSSTQIPL